MRPVPRLRSVLTVLCLLSTGILIKSVQAQSAKPIFILMGPPASGKSTLAARIQTHYGFALISRDQLVKDDPSVLARNKQPDIQGVDPRIDPALNGLFLKRLEKTTVGKALLLDGYPSTKDHADFFVKLIQERNLRIPRIYKLELSDEAVRQRLKGQDPVQIEQDLKDYHRETDYFSTYFPKADIVELDASKSEDAIFNQIRNDIDEYLKKP